MKYTVITTFNQAGLKQYGQRMIDTFEQYWPAEVDLVVYAENCKPTVSRANTCVTDLLSDSADLQQFIHRHHNNPLAHGQSTADRQVDPKKQFRWDAVRFAYKVFSTALAATTIKTDWLIWLDADTHTHSLVPMSGLLALCPDDSMISYLGRSETYHSECGWVAYNLNNSQTQQFIKDFVDMYNKDEIFALDEWHDSYVWDVVRRRYCGANKFYNLNPAPDTKGLAGHPFINSALGLYLDHVKGKRKIAGQSKAKDIAMHLDHPYWKKVLGK